MGPHQQRGMPWPRILHRSQYRRHHDDLRLHAQLRGPVRRAVNTPDQLGARSGRAAWSQYSGRSAAGVTTDDARRGRRGRRHARARAANGSRTGRWCTSCARQDRVGQANQPEFPASPRRRTRTAWRSSNRRPAPSAGRATVERRAPVRNAFDRGLQAAALKPADFFGNDDVLYLMEDMATGEIRLSIL
jgi:malate synthase